MRKEIENYIEENKRNKKYLKKEIKKGERTLGIYLFEIFLLLFFVCFFQFLIADQVIPFLQSAEIENKVVNISNFIITLSAIFTPLLFMCYNNIIFKKKEKELDILSLFLATGMVLILMFVLIMLLLFLLMSFILILIAFNVDAFLILEYVNNNLIEMLIFLFFTASLSSFVHYIYTSYFYFSKNYQEKCKKTKIENDTKKIKLKEIEESIYNKLNSIDKIDFAEMLFFKNNDKDGLALITQKKKDILKKHNLKTWEDLKEIKLEQKIKNPESKKKLINY